MGGLLYLEGRRMTPGRVGSVAAVYEKRLTSGSIGRCCAAHPQTVGVHGGNRS